MRQGMNALGRLDAIAGDFVYAFRGVRRNPSLAVMAILAIAIAVGAAAGMFGVMRNLLLAPPPHVSEPDRVFRFHQAFFEDSTNALAEPFSGTSYPFYELVSANAETIESAAAYWAEDVPAGTGATSRMTQAVMVSPDFWSTLGANPTAGRFFQGDEAHPALGERVVVLGHSFWQAAAT
jgi:hypothetical protein